MRGRSWRNYTTNRSASKDRIIKKMKTKKGKNFRGIYKFSNSESQRNGERRRIGGVEVRK